MRQSFTFDNVSKFFESRDGQPLKAIDGVSFDSPEGLVTCIVGPTASGKTTLLRMAAGLESPDAGEVRVATDVRGAIGYMTQEHTLFPWMRVEENIGLPLELRKVGAGSRGARVAEIMNQLGLEGSAGLYPYELSGGMRQRAALGRLLAQESRLWLLDEPFSAVDERTRFSLQRLLLGLVRERRISVLFVTHSISEAIYLADRVVVLSSGPGKVLEIFEPGMAHPRNRVSPEFGELVERVRREIEAVITGAAP